MFWALSIVSGSQLPNLEFPKQLEQLKQILLLYLVFVLIPESLQSHKGEMGVMLFITIPFLLYLSLYNGMNFEKHLGISVGAWLPRKLSID